jgi:hypothetical protein
MHTLGPKLPVLARLVLEHQPDCYIELGAFRLETTKVLSELMSKDAAIVAVDLFEQAAQIEKPPQGELPLTLAEAEKVMGGLEQAHKRAVKADTRTLKPEDLPELATARRPFVFIDGGHSVETSIGDFKLVMGALAKGTKGKAIVVVIDDVGMAGTDAVEPMAKAWATLHDGVVSSDTSMLILRGGTKKMSKLKSVSRRSETWLSALTSVGAALSAYGPLAGGTNRQIEVWASMGALVLTVATQTLTRTALVADHPGWKTKAFWGSVAMVVASVALAISEANIPGLPPGITKSAAVGVAALTAAGYSGWRYRAKGGSGG